MSHRRLGVFAIATGLALSACSSASTTSSVEAPPALTEPTEQEGISRITLTERAAERLGITIGEVTQTSVDGTTQMVMPYGALIYDPDGTTWAYTNPEGLVYVRAPVTVDRVDGDRVVLQEGPASGTDVVSVGAAELYGIEYGIGE